MAYNLSLIPGFMDVFASNQERNKDQDQYTNPYFTVLNYSTKSNEPYNVIRYRKEILAVDLVPSYGLLRSVIVNCDGQIVSFAPPKSMPADNFMNLYTEPTNIVAEEFIEGTMINVFYDPSCSKWKIATRNTVDADVVFYKDSTKTFKTMFFEACVKNNLVIEALNPNYCHSFVLQHPDNRIVVPFKEPRLYLVEVYEIKQENGNILVVPQDIQGLKTTGLLSTGVRFPERYDFTSYSELIENFASPNTYYNVMGVVIKNLETLERTKLRNPNYEEVRHLRGNQSKVQYQYLSLRREGQLPEFLKYYPELKKQFSEYRDQVHMFTNTLHKNYISCYVKKEKPLNQFSSQYKTHMFKLHEKYLSELREQGLFMTNTQVIDYVNKMHPSLLMHCLNYHFRKQNIDTIKADNE